jgi:hypothetical protein
MKLVSLIGAVIGGVAAAALLSAPTFAGPTLTFTPSVESSNSIGYSDVGTITVTQGDTGLTFPTPPGAPACPTVESCVTVDLTFNSSSYGVLHNQIPFVFELDTAVVNEEKAGAQLTATFTDPPKGTYSAGQFSFNPSTTNSYSQPGVAHFNNEITSTAGHGSPNAYYGELTFVLSCASNCTSFSIDTNDFTTSGSSGVYFSADVTNGSKTGPQEWLVKTPEPATILLFGSMLAPLGLLRRKRRPLKTA